MIHDCEVKFLREFWAPPLVGNSRFFFEDLVSRLAVSQLTLLIWAVFKMVERQCIFSRNFKLWIGDTFILTFFVKFDSFCILKASNFFRARFSLYNTNNADGLFQTISTQYGSSYCIVAMLHAGLIASRASPPHLIIGFYSTNRLLCYFSDVIS